MPVTFRLANHSLLPDIQVVEVLVNGEVAAVIYPGEGKSIRVVSAHMVEAHTDSDFAGEVVQDDGWAHWPPIPAHHIRFDPSPYLIQGRRIVKLKKR